MLQQLLGLVAIARRHRDADAGADHDRMAIQQIGFADRLQQARASSTASSGRTIPLCTIANSSELRRASVSSSRSVERNRLATPRSSLSPTAWPSVSLTALKLSRP